MKIKPWLMKLSFFFILGLTWEVVAYSGHYPEALFPKLETILLRFGELIANDSLIFKALYSIFIVLISMFLSLILAFILAALSSKYMYIKVNVNLLSTIISPIPGVALLPIIILWLGISRGAMVVIMVHAMLWPLLTQVKLAVDRVTLKYNRMMVAFKIPLLRRFFYVYFKGIIPDLMVGLEIAWSRGWRALLSIEMIFGIVGNQSGLGWLIYERRMYMDTAGMFAGLIAIALCGIAFESFLFKRKKLEDSDEIHYPNRESL